MKCVSVYFMCLSIFICDVRAKPPSMYVFHYCTKESQIWLLNIGVEIVSFRLTYLWELPNHFQFSQSFLINFLHLQFFGFIRAQFICKTTYIVMPLFINKMKKLHRYFKEDLLLIFWVWSVSLLAMLMYYWMVIW